MSEIQKIANEITEAQIASKGVSALATRPNRAGQYGQSGLSAADLKAHFDLLATTIATELNKVIGNLATANAGDYIGVNLENADIHTLSALITSFTDGSFASTVCKVAGINDSTITETLDNALTKLSGSISAIKEQLGMGNEGGGGSGGEGETLPDSAKAAVLQRGSVVGSIQQFDRVDGKVVASEALARGAIALGEGTKATNANQVVLGKYNSEDNNAIFIIGNGKGNDQRNNVLVVKSDKGTYKLYLNDKEIANKEYIDTKVDKVSGDLTIYASATDSSIAYLTGEVTNAKTNIDLLKSQMGGAQSNISILTAASKKHITKVEIVDVSEKGKKQYRYKIKLTRGDGLDPILSDELDLPLESIITKGEYNSESQTIKLTLHAGSVVDIPVGDLIDGLVSPTELQKELTNYALSSDLDKKADSITVNGISATVDSIAARVTEVEDAISDGVGTIKSISVNGGDPIEVSDSGNVDIEIPEVELPSDIVTDVTINGGSVVSGGVANINFATLTRKYVTILPTPPEGAEYWWDDAFVHEDNTYLAICTADSELSENVLGVYVDEAGDGNVSEQDEIFYKKVEHQDDSRGNYVAYLVGLAKDTKRGTYILEKNGTVAVGGSGKLYKVTMSLTYTHPVSGQPFLGIFFFYTSKELDIKGNTFSDLVTALSPYGGLCFFLHNSNYYAVKPIINNIIPLVCLSANGEDFGLTGDTCRPTGISVNHSEI